MVTKVLLEIQSENSSLVVNVDNRTGSSSKIQIPDEVHLNKNGQDIILRDYQLRGVKEAMEKQRVILNIATNGGKTLTTAGIIKYDLKTLDDSDNILFMVNRVSIAEQTKAVFEDALKTNIGYWSSSKKDIRQVTVATTGTISSAIKDPTKDMKLTSKKDKILQYMVNRFNPLFKHLPNKGVVIKNYLNSHEPKNSYETECFEQLQQMLDEKLSDKDIAIALNWYNKEWEKLLFTKNKKAMKKYTEALEYLKSVKVVIVDEAQHASAQSFQNILNTLINAKQRIALTGTMPSDELKKRQIIGSFSDNIIKVSNTELIERGVSAKPKIVEVPVMKPQDLEMQVNSSLPVGIPKKQIPLVKYQKSYDLGVVKNTYRNELISKLVNGLYTKGNGVILIVINRVEHGELIEQAIRNINPDITVSYLKGEDSSEKREDVTNLVKQGKIDVLIGTTIIDEGIDIPNFKYMVYASAGKSSVQVLQRIGRMLRKDVNKDTVIVYDLFDRTSKQLYKHAVERERIYLKDGHDVEKH